jgi:hypothetical protein
MRSLMLRSGVLLLVLFSSSLSSPTPALTQEDDADTKAYYSYQLTMPKYKKYLAAIVSLANASQRTPAVDQALETAMNASIDEAVAHFNRVPEARRGIADAGLTTRDFVLTQGALLQAGVAYGLMKEQGMSPDSALSIMQVSPANLDFVRKNEAEITRLTKEAEAKAPALKRKSDAAGEGGE